MKQAQSADGVMHEFPDNTPDEVVDRAMKEYARSPHPDPIAKAPPYQPGKEIAQDVVRGAGRGLVQGLEDQQPFRPWETPEEAGGRALPSAQPPPAPVEDPWYARPHDMPPQPPAASHIDPPETPYGEIAQSVSRGVPSAIVQPGGPVTKAVTTVGGGLGSWLGEKAADYLGLPSWLGGVTGGLVGGGGGGLAAERTAAARARRMLPGAAENTRASKAAAQMMIDEGLQLVPHETQALAGDIWQTLRGMFFRPKLRGDIGFDAAKQIERSNGDFGTLVNVHSNLGGVSPAEGPNYVSAMVTRHMIREWVSNLENNPHMVISGDAALTNQLWKHHRDTWRIKSNLEEIADAVESAEWRRLVSGRGTNYNTLRQEIRKIVSNDQIANRFDDRAREEMIKIVEGDLARNVLRRAAAFAPHTAVSAGPAIVAGALGGMDAGMTLAGTAFLAHFLQGKLEHEAIERLNDIIRLSSPLAGPVRKRAQFLLQPPRATGGAVLGALSGAGSPLSDEPAPELAPAGP